MRQYVRRPVRHLVRLSRDVVAAVLVQLEGQGGHPGAAREQSLTTPAAYHQPADRSVHHADPSAFSARSSCLPLSTPDPEKSHI